MMDLEQFHLYGFGVYQDLTRICNDGNAVGIQVD